MPPTHAACRGHGLQGQRVISGISPGMRSITSATRRNILDLLLRKMPSGILVVGAQTNRTLGADARFDIDLHQRACDAKDARGTNRAAGPPRFPLNDRSSRGGRHTDGIQKRRHQRDGPGHELSPLGSQLVHDRAIDQREQGVPGHFRRPAWRDPAAPRASNVSSCRDQTARVDLANMIC
jgi:hypothetical protein